MTISSSSPTARPQWWATDAARGAARSFVQSFLAILIPGALGWLNGLTQWATNEGQAPLPDARSLAYLGVAAVAAGFVALVTFVQRAVENTTGKGLLRNVPR